jgi:hypothetical protein
MSDAIETALEIATRIVTRDAQRNCDITRAQLRARFLAYGAVARACRAAPRYAIARAVGFDGDDAHAANRRYNAIKSRSKAIAAGRHTHGSRWWSQAIEDEVLAALSKFEPVTIPCAETNPPPAPAPREIAMERTVESNAGPARTLVTRRYFIRPRPHIIELWDLPKRGSIYDQLRGKT